MINVTAGDTIHSTTTNYFSNSPVSLTATDVDIDGKHNSSHVVQTHEEKRSGLTVSVGGQVVSALNTAQQLGKRANSRKTSALSAFEYGEAANSIKHAYNDAKAYSKIKPVNLLDKEREVLSKANELNKSYQLEHPEIENAVHPDVQNAIDKEQKYKQEQARKDRLLNINVSIGSSKYKQRNELNEEQYIGSSIGSKTKVDITANSNDMAKGNIHITGSRVEAPVVNVSASNNLRMDAGTNTVVQRDDYTSSGWSIGATVSPHGSGVIGLDANVYKGKENALETTKTHTGTVILGKQVNTVSGNNTEIIGSKVIGESVTTKVGHDLKIESLQDTNDYHKISKNKGISVSYGMSGSARVGFDNSRGTTDSHYASVTNQAGIYAGDGGYNVQVNHATTLTGGIIKGSPDKSKNRLSSNSLKMNDIQNEASYSAKTSGYSLSTTKRTKNNPIGITGSPKMGIPVKGSAKSTTHSAISEGIIEIAEKESLEKINHDTEQALNKLAPIFDKKTVEEKQILLNKISEHGYKLIGDVSAHQQTILLDKAVKAKMKGENAKADKYYQESKKWGDNGIYKVSLHASLGGFLSNYSGSNIISGVKASGVNESLQSLINKSTNPEFRKIISLVIGKVVSGDIGGALAEKATTYNWLEHQNRQDLNYDISQLLFTNAYGYDEDTRWSKLREKVAYYYALMEYERDYHDYYDSDNLVHATDGGHIGEPYYTDESYSALLNNLFAYVVGSDPDNINYYTHLKEYYYNKFVSEEKYIQDKGYNVRTYDAGWQESDGQYYNKLINGGTVLNGRFRGKQLELEGYPTVLGDDGQTHYTLDENGRPWYNPNPSESSINRIVWQGYQDTDGQFFNVLADGRKVLTGEYKGNYNAKAGLAIEFDRDTRTFSSGGFPIFPDGDKELLRLTSWVEFKADLNYAGETGMLIAGGNSLGRGVLPRGVKAGNSRQNSGNVIRYAREYPKTEKGYYGTSSKGSGKAFVREIPGGEQEARKFFETISKGGKIKPTNNPDNIMKEMPDGRIIQFRPKSKSGDAAVDISESEAGPRQKIHFPE